MCFNLYIMRECNESSNLEGVLLRLGRRTGSFHAVPRDIMVGGDKGVGGVAGFHAEEPVFILRVPVGGELVPTHPGAGGPQELLVEPVGVQGDGQEAAIS